MLCVEDDVLRVEVVLAGVFQGVKEGIVRKVLYGSRKEVGLVCEGSLETLVDVLLKARNLGPKFRGVL